jgi:hypothetical protein
VTAARLVPKTKLWARGIILECTCGNAVDYPGHPDERETVACSLCGQLWTVKP